MDIQRLRNLTTGRLHTEMDFVYQDLEEITDQFGLMTHMLPRMLKAITPWLKKHVTDERFWDGEYDRSHVGEYVLPMPTEVEREEMTTIFMGLPNPLHGEEL